MNNALFGTNVNAPVVSSLKVSEILPDPNQPRKYFDDEALKELAITIKEKGLIQPIIVRSTNDDGYIIIAGERRWRAVQLNGAETIQAIVRNDLDVRAASLIENIQRQNLKPMEEAEAIHSLMEENNISQGEVATMLGTGRASINQLLKIRNLPSELQAESIALDTPKSILVELASIKNNDVISRLWKRSKNEALSIADIRRVRDAKKKSKEKAEEEVELTLQERMIRKAFEALEILKDNPLSESERARLIDLQAKIVTILEN